MLCDGLFCSKHDDRMRYRDATEGNHSLTCWARLIIPNDDVEEEGKGGSESWSLGEDA